jgi:putative PIN family toxin of toxin-antitoxin system
MQELHDTLEKPKLKNLIPSHIVGRLFNDLRKDAEVVRSSPYPNRSPDPADNYLLGMAEAGGADYLVTGDKGHLLVLLRHQGTRILSVRAFLDVLQ